MRQSRVIILVFTLGASLAAQSPEPTLNVIFSKGGEVPDAGGHPEIPAESVWRTLGIPSVVDDREIAFVGSTRSPLGSASQIYKYSLFDAQLRPVAGTNQPAPGAGDGVLFASFKDPLINGRGDVAFLANLTGAGVTSANNQGLFVDSTDSDSDRLVAREAAQPPGVATGAQWKSFTSVAFARESHPGGQWSLAFTATMATGPNGAAGPGGVTRLDDTGLWLADGLRTQLALREGQSLEVAGAPKTVKAFHAFKPLANAAGHGYGATPAGVPVKVICTDNTHVLLRITLPPTEVEGPVIETLALTGDTVDGVANASLARLGIPTQNSLGNVTAWISGLASRLNAQAIVSTDSTGNLTLVARKGDPLSPDPGALTFAGFSSVVVNHEGRPALLGKLAGNEVATANDTVIARRAVTPGWEIVAREGAHPPGTPVGAQWASFPGYALGDETPTLAFVGQLRVPKGDQPNPAGVTTANDRGLWTSLPGEAPVLALREGDLLNGKTIRSFTALSAVNGSPTQRRTLSRAGRDLVVRVIATDGSHHLLHIRLPAPPVAAAP